MILSRTQEDRRQGRQARREGSCAHGLQVCASSLALLAKNTQLHARIQHITNDCKIHTLPHPVCTMPLLLRHIDTAAVYENEKQVGKITHTLSISASLATLDFS